MSEPHSAKLLTGDSAILAKRYAGALYELAAESNQVDVVSSEMQNLKSLYRENAEFRRIVDYPLVSRAKLTELMRQTAKAAELSVLVGNFLALLAKNRRLNIIEGIIDAFDDRISTERGEFSAEVCAAAPLNPEQERQLTTHLQKMTGGKIRLNIRQVPDLLGGITVKLGSRFIDASLRGKLARIEKQLKAQREAA